MSEYSIKIVFRATDNTEVPEESFVSIADAFFDLDTIDDHEVTAEAGRLTFDMSISSDDEVTGLTAAITAVRTAVHAADTRATSGTRRG